MQEIRLHFSPTQGDSFSATLTNSQGAALGDAVAFTPFLSDKDYTELRWYLEEFMELPDGGALVRAQALEAALAQWGCRLHDAIFSTPANQHALAQLLAAPEPRLLTLATNAPALLRLPWELMADDAGKLAQRVSLRRQLAPELATPASASASTPVPVPATTPVARPVTLPLRMLYIVSRPQDVGFIDPRLSSQALLAALDPLGAAVQLDFCRPPTLARLQAMLREGTRAGRAYDVVHFDGHGAFSPQEQIGALCFEADDTGMGDCTTELVAADTLGDLLAQHCVPLVVLAACRSTTLGKTNLLGAIAPRLLHAGVGSVLAMGHAVHVQAARVLLDRFYRELLGGTSIGHAVVQGRSALRTAAARWLEAGPGAASVALQDWFLPQLYQRGADCALLPVLDEAAPPLRQFDLFLSHNHNDKKRVAALATRLANSHGLRVWLDAWECKPGKLKPQCEAGLRNSRFTVVAGSQAALDSDWVQWEIAKHREFNAHDPDYTHLIPVKFETLTLPKALNELLWVDFTDPAQEVECAAHLARLIHSADADDARQRNGYRAPARGRDASGPFPPPPPYGFQGRARELHALERQLRQQRGVVLHAMGGMGKTALATEAAHWWTRSGRFKDGACFISFEQFTSAERVVQVLGCYLLGEQFNQLPAATQRQRVVAEFQSKHVLMVWDNFESTLAQFHSPGADHASADNTSAASPDPSSASPYTEDERHRLAELFRELTSGVLANGLARQPGDGGCVLVTCRPGDTALPGAGHLELHGLVRADSLWLLSAIVQRQGRTLNQPGLERAQLEPLLDDLADHPLSIELVGPHLRHLTPQAIRTDFGKLLAEFRQSAPEARNTSLLASLEFSLRHLSPSARAALPWLGLFGGGVFEQLLLNISQIAPADWEAIRRELQGIALLRVESDIEIGDRPYLRFHPTLTMAVADGALARQTQTRRRFIQVYLGLMRALDQALRGSQSRAALEILDREAANYRQAVYWALADGLLREAFSLGDTFRVYLERSGRLREHDAWVDRLKEALQQGAFTEEVAVMEMQHAQTLFTQGDPQGAVQQLQALIERLRNTTEFDPAVQIATAVLTLGRLLDAAGAAKQAVPVLREAVELWQGLVQIESGQAWADLLAAKAHAQASGELGNLSAAMGDLANALCDMGQHDAALVLAEQSLLINQQRGNQREVAAGHGRCASILTAAGHYAEADKRYDAALHAARKAGDQGLEGTTLQHQGSLAVEQVQLDRAARLYQQALQLFQAAGDQHATMRTYNSLGVVEQESGRLPAARAWHEQSRRLAEDLKDQPGIGQAAHNIGIVCQLEGEAVRAQCDEPAAQRSFQAALLSVTQSLRVWQVLGNTPGEAACLAQLAIIHLHLHDLDAAERHAHLAREIFEALNLPDLYKIYGTLSKIAQARGDSAAAAEWAGQRAAKVEQLNRLARGEQPSHTGA